MGKERGGEECATSHTWKFNVNTQHPQKQSRAGAEGKQNSAQFCRDARAEGSWPQAGWARPFGHCLSTNWAHWPALQQAAQGHCRRVLPALKQLQETLAARMAFPKEKQVLRPPWGNTQNSKRTLHAHRWHSHTQLVAELYHYYS